ncbi:MAG: cell division protein FtsQ/DivIB [Kineothrix sp.]|nr:cell division protein FtsQ/DivIB [Kineothrix sp.]NBI92048.1 FtsQ-type POTRA domain-containing protein [Lachnospiraceae bacterium]
MVQNKSLIIMGLTAAAIICVLVGIYRYIVTAYEVTTVYVDGNVHYTNEEIMEMVMGGRYGNNSLYLAAKYKDKGIEGIPFVEKMDVNILSPDTIRISVYEKALAGYVEYLGRYMYFDRDGIVVESSEERTSGIPQVTGLKFDYIVLNDYLPVENDEIFKRILDITQLLNKYELMADKIFFDSTYELTLFFDGIRVTLGSDSNIDQKIIHLKNILPNLEGKTGTLRMENYTEGTKNITFLQE